MNVLRLIAGIIALAWAAPVALAAEAAREDSSSLAIYIFLGFCALIVVAQLLPIFRIRLSRRHAAIEAKEAVPVTDSEQRP